MSTLLEFRPIGSWDDECPGPAFSLKCTKGFGGKQVGFRVVGHVDHNKEELLTTLEGMFAIERKRKEGNVIELDPRMSRMIRDPKGINSLEFMSSGSIGKALYHYGCDEVVNKFDIFKGWWDMLEKYPDKAIKNNLSNHFVEYAGQSDLSYIHLQ